MAETRFVVGLARREDPYQEEEHFLHEVVGYRSSGPGLPCEVEEERGVVLDEATPGVCIVPLLVELPQQGDQHLGAVGFLHDLLLHCLPRSVGDVLGGPKCRHQSI